jgi:hypothetical protein
MVKLEHNDPAVREKWFQSKIAALNKQVQEQGEYHYLYSIKADVLETFARAVLVAQVQPELSDADFRALVRNRAPDYFSKMLGFADESNAVA